MFDAAHTGRRGRSAKRMVNDDARFRIGVRSLAPSPHGPRRRPGARWPRASGAACSSWAATMPSMVSWQGREPRPRRRAPLPLAPVGTAGQRCTSTRRVFVARAIGARPAGRATWKRCAPMAPSRLVTRSTAGTLMGPLIEREGAWRVRWNAERPGARPRHRAGASSTAASVVAEQRAPRSHSTSSPDHRDARRRRPSWSPSPGRRRSHRFCTCSKYRLAWKQAIEAAQRLSRRAFPRAIFTTDSLQSRRALPVRQQAVIAASPTSTSAPRAPRSAAPSAARRKLAAVASRVRTPGASTCAG